MNTLTKCGTVFLLLGAVLLAGPVFGFSSLAADRGVLVETTSNENAIVALSSTGETVEHPDDSVVATLGNNMGGAAHLETTVDAGDFTVSDDFADELSASGPDRTTSLALECGGVSGSGEKDVTVTVEIAEAAGVTVESVTEQITVQYDCPGPETGDLVVEDVSPDGTGGVVNFDLANTGEGEFQLREVSVDWTPTETSQIGVGDSEGSISVDNSVASSTDWSIGSDGNAGDQIEIDDSPSLGGGESVSIEIDEFADGETPVDMTEQSFEITFYDTRGGPNEQQETLQVDVPCSASQNHECADTSSNVIIDDNDEAYGEVSTEGDVSIGEQSTVQDGVVAGGNVAAGDNSIVNGNFDVSGDVTAGDGVTINDGLTADGDVTAGSGVTIHGQFESGGEVTVGDGATISDGLTGGGDVEIGDGSTIWGDIVVPSGSEVTLGDDVTFTGNIIEE